MSERQRTRDLAQVVLAATCLGGLTVGSFWVLRPFLAGLTWAVLVVVSTWGFLLQVQRRCGGRRWLATVVMTLLLLLLFVLPLLLAISVMVHNAPAILGFVRGLADFHLPGPPEWLHSIPMIGGPLEEFWLNGAALGASELATQLGPFTGEATRWLLLQLGGLGHVMVQGLVTVVVSAMLYLHGEYCGHLALACGARLAGAQGRSAVMLAAGATRGVAIGIGVTALAQAALGGIGLAICQVPFAGLLTAVMLLLCIAQLGPLLVLVGAAGWLYWHGSVGWALFLLVWSLIPVVMDNVLRTILIQRGADLPLVLIFAGVIGGLLSFGLVGLFLGPVILAVTYTLLLSWVNESPES